jgi:L-threonylcarbamoyladenylate synthase
VTRAEILRVDPLRPDPGAIARAAGILRTGGLVAFPTETVYGLGAHARDAAAVDGIFRAKGRPGDNPLIVHVDSADAASALTTDWTALAGALAASFWPGPLTLVLDAAPGLAPAVSAGLGTVAVRVPQHPVALALLRAAGIPVAAPSANRSGRPSPTTAAHVMDDLGEAIDALVDGGACPVGLESTVVDARGTTPVLLREGSVTREALGAVAEASADGLRASPGTRHRHYRPACAVRLADPGAAGIVAATLAAGGRRVGLIAREGAPAGVVHVGGFADAAELAERLYDLLRRAEDLNLDVVVVETVAEDGIGRAIMDRLRRAAED